MTVKDLIVAYLLRAKPRITSKELARVIGLNYNTTRKIVGQLKRQGIIQYPEKKSRGFEFVEKAEEYVIKYLSSVLYCGSVGANHHGTKKTAYAYTFEISAMNDNNRSDDLYEAIRSAEETRYCYEIDVDQLDSFGKNYGYGVEPRKRIEDQYVYPNIAVRVDGRKVQ